MERVVPHNSRWAERRSTLVYGTFSLVLTPPLVGLQFYFLIFFYCISNPQGSTVCVRDPEGSGSLLQGGHEI